MSGLIILILMAAGCTGKDKKEKDEVDGLSTISQELEQGLISEEKALVFQKRRKSSWNRIMSLLLIPGIL